MTSTLSSGPLVTDQAVELSLPDEKHELTGVTLYQEVRRPRLGPGFARNGDTWTLRWARPNADRMEYKLKLAWRSGNHELVCDPTNPLRAPGPFGEKSVIEWPGYRAPGWLDTEVEHAGSILETKLPVPAMRAELPLMLWSSHGTSHAQRLPLLIVHDGPEYGEYSKLLTLLDHVTGSGELPPMRAALIGPGDRDNAYSASALYARALAHEVLPWLREHAPAPEGRSTRIGMGASLGALAMLHVHRTYPASFGSLFLQSGSYFRQRWDSQEASFPRFRRISRFVGRVLSSQDWSHPVRMVMTCGAAEENLTNNRAMRDALDAQGYAVDLTENRDAHNWVGWRDALHPDLVALLTEMWT